MDEEIRKEPKESVSTDEEKTTEAVEQDDLLIESEENKRNKVVRRAVNLLVFTVLAILTIVVMITQTGLWQRDKTNNAEKLVNRIADNMIESNGYENSIVSAYLGAYRSELDVIRRVLSDHNVHEFDSQKRKDWVEVMRTLRSISKSSELYVTDAQGNLILASDEAWIGGNVVELGEFTGEQLTQLIYRAQNTASTGETDPLQNVVVGQADGNSYFFARQLENSNQEPVDAYLILGYDSESVDRATELSIDRTLMVQTVESNNVMIDFYLIDSKTGRVLYSADDGKELENYQLTYDETEDLSKGVRGTIKFDSEEKSHACYARLIKADNQRDVILIASYGLEQASIEDAAHSFTGVVACGFSILLISFLLLIYGSYAARGVLRFRKFAALTVGAVVLCTGIFSVIAYYAVSLMLLTAGTDNAIKTESILVEREAGIGNATEEIEAYFKQIDLDSVAMIAYDIEFSGAELIDANARPHAYLEGSSYGDYKALTDSFSNSMICYAGAKVLKNKLDLLNASRIYLINDMGYAIASGSEDEWSYNVNQQADVKEIRDVLYGRKKYRYTYRTNEKGERTGIRIDYPIRLYAISDGNGTTRYLSSAEYQKALAEYQTSQTSADSEAQGPKELSGLLAVEIDGTPAAENTIRNSYFNLYDQITDLTGASVVLYEKEKQMTAVYPAKPLSKKDLMALKLPEKMGDGQSFNYFREAGGTDCLIRTVSSYSPDEKGTMQVGMYRSIVMPSTVVYADRSEMTKAYIIDAAVLFLILGFYLFLAYYKPIKERESRALALLHGEADAAPVQSTEAEDSGAEEQTETAKEQSKPDPMLRILKRMKLQQAFERTDTTAMLLIQITLIAAAVFIATNVFNRNTEEMSGLFVNIFGSEWERCFNMFNILAVLAMFIEIIVVFSFLKRLVEIFFVPLGPKVETYAKLILSAIKYLLVFAGLFYAAYLLGVEVKNLQTAGTILAGIVALNSQAFATDITNGLTMITEGGYMIGDHVNVDNFSGVIKEVGIRNSTLVNEQGMIKTVSNGNLVKAIRLQKPRS